MKITDNNVLRLSNGLKFIYNPKLFNNLETVLAHSIEHDENTLTEELLLKLNSIFDIQEVNFIGTDKIIIKTDQDIHVAIEFTKTKITSVRAIAFFVPSYAGLQIMAHGQIRANIEIKELPLAYEDKTSLSFDRINEIESIVERLIVLLTRVEFGMIAWVRRR